MKAATRGRITQCVLHVPLPNGLLFYDVETGLGLYDEGPWLIELLAPNWAKVQQWVVPEHAQIFQPNEVAAFVERGGKLFEWLLSKRD